MTISMVPMGQARPQVFPDGRPQFAGADARPRIGSGLVRTALLLLLGSAHASGALVAPRSLSALEGGADVIAVGTATGNFQAGSGLFTLSIARVLKGVASLAGQAIVVNWPSRTAGSPGAAATRVASGTGLWFIQASPTGWTLIPVFGGDVPMGMTFFPEGGGALPSAYAYTAGAQLSDQLASELCSAVEGLGGGYSLPLYTLLNGQLDVLNSAVVATFYQRMASSGVPEQQAIGLSGEIRAGATGAVATAARNAVTFANSPKEYGILLRTIRDDLRPVDTATVSALGAAAAEPSSPSSFREAAAHALAAVHSLGTLPYLAALLSDPDVNLRIEAIGGIGSFANGLPAQNATGAPSLAYLQPDATSPYKTSATMAHFALGYLAIEQNENFYLTFWQQWWTQNRAALGF